MRKKTGYIQCRGTSWRIAYYSADHARQFESFATEEEAHRELAKRLAEVASGIPVSSKPNIVKFGELCADVVTDYRVRRLKSVDDIETRFRLHIVPVFGDRKAISITTAQLRQYVLQRDAEGAKTGTINRELEAIRRAFLLASREGKSLTRGPHIPMLPDTNRRKGFFTREEVERLCSHLKWPLDSFVMFGFLTGWRLDEIRNLQWRNVDFVASEIRLDPGTTKNREARVFPMTDELRALLWSQKTRTTSKSIDHHAAMTVVKSPRMTAITGRVFLVGAFRKSWRTACIKAGLCIPSIDGKKPIVTRIFHDLRRACARELVRQGIPERVVMQMCGWLTRSVLDRYNIVSESDMRAARDILNGARNGAKNGFGSAGNQ